MSFEWNFICTRPESKLKTKMQFTRCKHAHCARNVNKVVRMTVVLLVMFFLLSLCIWLHPSWWFAMWWRRSKRVSIWFDAERKTVRCSSVCVCRSRSMFIVIHFYDFHHINVITWNFVNRLCGLWQIPTKFAHLIWMALRDNGLWPPPFKCNDFIV